MQVLQAAAVLLAAGYLGLNVMIPLTPARLDRPAAALMQEFPLWTALSTLQPLLPQHPGGVAVLLITLVVTVFATYAVAVQQIWRAGSQRRLARFVAGTSVLFFLLSLFAMPNVNTDIFNYMLRGRLAAVHHANPYYVAADNFPDDPVYPYASKHYTDEPNAKFPGWMLINVPLAWLGGDHAATALLVYRFAFFLLNATSLFLIAKILQRLRPAFQVPGLLIYGWNPIIVMYGQSKTDIVMAFYFLLGVYLLLGTRKYAAYACFALSVFVKLITAPLVALFWLSEIAARRWKEVAAGSAALLLTTVLIYLPFMRDPGLVFFNLSKMGEGGSMYSGTARLALKGIYILFVVYLGLRSRGESEDLIRRWALAMLFFIIVLAPFSLSWYSITVVALVALVPDWRYVSVSIAVAFGGYLLNAWYSTFNRAFAAPEVLFFPSFYVYLALPFIVLAAGFAIRHNKRRRALQGGYQSGRQV